MSTWSILKNNNCHHYRINGIEDHLHSVTQLQPSVARAALVKNIKLGSATLIWLCERNMLSHLTKNTCCDLFPSILPAVGDNTARQTDQWKIEEGLKTRLFCFLFHYALQLHGRFEKCELIPVIPPLKSEIAFYRGHTSLHKSRPIQDTGISLSINVLKFPLIIA